MIKDHEHIMFCLNDLSKSLRQIAKYLENAAHDATRIALDISRQSATPTPPHGKDALCAPPNSSKGHPDEGH